MASSYFFERCYLGGADHGENGTLVNGLISVDLRAPLAILASVRLLF